MFIFQAYAAGAGEDDGECFMRVIPSLCTVGTPTRAAATEHGGVPTVAQLRFPVLNHGLCHSPASTAERVSIELFLE